MQHIMVDSYGVSRVKLDNLKYIYDGLNSIAYENDLISIMPPSLIPYYYSAEHEDEGISSFLLLKGGHITIHTFPYRECYFLDILYEDFIDIETIKKQLNKIFPSSHTITNEADRRQVIKEKSKYLPSLDFGPHIIYECDVIDLLNMEIIFDTLDSFPTEIGMNAISRPYVIYDNSIKPNYLSGIVIIAESHISIHQNLLNKKVYLDIFSCKFFNIEISKSIIQRVNGINVVSSLITRGSKHTDIKSDNFLSKEQSGYWARNVQ